ncbi:nucleoside hydrolase [Clostridium sp. D2Q-11]|uniref:Nucleoside hydrolase n=1 Tax=Anaeromonas frigoriresistens TaxID=2683708 RepID=A0A942URR8_9FIRM|nr:nucleoside hydrolase [Anaeromonas frigoriresistens]MBS4538049.1 nucleoside hydrolase [Anaeromonas frigoriresistens]
MNKIIFDCDNTMGVKERDVDDGLTLLYLLGNEKINLLGVTNTFGNSDIETVTKATQTLFNDLDITSKIPLYKGGGSIDDPISDASKFLVKMVNKSPKEITILATGSLTNLYGAYMEDKDFFKKVKDIVIMGGILEPLIFNGKIMDELNLSSDANAAYNVLSSDANITLISAQLCLQALFGKHESNRVLEEQKPIFNYIRKMTLPWYEFIKKKYGIEGFHNWDIVAAVYITNPELFDENIVKVGSTVEDLKTGFIRKDSSEKSYKLNIPIHINDKDKFNDTIFDSWNNVEY